MCDIDIGLTSYKESISRAVTMMNKSKTNVSETSDFKLCYGFSSNGTIYGTSNTDRYSQTQQYSGGDKIGCYVDMNKRICCFTKNDSLLNKVLKIPDSVSFLYPTVLLRTNGMIFESYFEEKDFNFNTEGINLFQKELLKI